MLLDKFTDPKPIREILKNRGGYTIRRSKRFRELIKFDETLGHLFDIFYEKPFLRLIFHYFVSEVFKNEIHDINTIVSDFRIYHKNIEKSIPGSPLLVEFCPQCGSDNFIKKERHGKQRYYCRTCKQEFNEPKSKSSLLELGPFDMYDFLDELVKVKILARGYQLTCYTCGEIISYPTGKDAEKNILCPKCNSLRELIQIFTLVKPTKEIKNWDSIWLEWYASKIICEKCDGIVSVLPLHIIHSENIKTEVDLIVLTENKNLVSIDCKAKIFKSTLSKNDIDNNILDWEKFSDSVLIVTTTEISRKCKEFWSSQLSNIVFVGGRHLEGLNDVISQEGKSGSKKGKGRKRAESK